MLIKIYLISYYIGFKCSENGLYLFTLVYHREKKTTSNVKLKKLILPNFKALNGLFVYI